MDASAGKFTSNKGNTGSMVNHKDEINIRGSPRKNRSRSPLRTNPPEVFSRSPRSNRQYEDGAMPSGRESHSPLRSGRASHRQGSCDEDRPQQAP